MTKAGGMSEWQVRRWVDKISTLKGPEQKQKYISRALKMTKLLKQNTLRYLHKVGHEDLAQQLEAKGKGGFIEAWINSGAPKEEVYSTYAKITERAGGEFYLEQAAIIYSAIGAREGHINSARCFEKLNKLSKYPLHKRLAADEYAKANEFDKAHDAYSDAAMQARDEALKAGKKGNDDYFKIYLGDQQDYLQKAIEMGDKKMAEKLANRKSWNTLNDIVTSILAFGGIGLVYSFFSKPNIISAQNIQLAPPFPNYLVYIFAAMLIGGAGYFIYKKIKK